MISRELFLRLPPRARCEAALGELVPAAELPPYAEMAAFVAKRVPIAIAFARE